MGKYNDLNEKLKEQEKKQQEFTDAGRDETDPQKKEDYARHACGAQARCHELREQMQEAAKEEDKEKKDGQEKQYNNKVTENVRD